MYPSLLSLDRWGTTRYIVKPKTVKPVINLRYRRYRGANERNLFPFLCFSFIPNLPLPLDPPDAQEHPRSEMIELEPIMFLEMNALLTTGHPLVCLQWRIMYSVPSANPPGQCHTSSPLIAFAATCTVGPRMRIDWKLLFETWVYARYWYWYSDVRGYVRIRIHLLMMKNCKQSFHCPFYGQLIKGRVRGVMTQQRSYVLYFLSL